MIFDTHNMKKDAPQCVHAYASANYYVD